MAASTAVVEALVSSLCPRLQDCVVSSFSFFYIYFFGSVQLAVFNYHVMLSRIVSDESYYAAQINDLKPTDKQELRELLQRELNGSKGKEIIQRATRTRYIVSQTFYSILFSLPFLWWAFSVEVPKKVP